VFPELDHNELVNLGALKQKDKFALILLRDKDDPDRIRLRTDITKSILSDKINDMIEVQSQGKSKLARILSLIYLGDFVSLYLSVLNGVDPTPVLSIDVLKKEMSKI
jgi:glucose/mannose-6-phosphate isomerase